MVVDVTGVGPAVVVGRAGLEVVVELAGAGGSVDAVVTGSLVSISLSLVLVSPPPLEVVLPSDDPGPLEVDSPTVVTAADVAGAQGSVVCTA